LLTDASEDLFGGSPLGGVLQNPFDRRSFRSISPNNAAHVLVINYLFELPFGKGRRFLNQGGVVDKLIGGWQLNGIQRYQSGTPLSFFTSDPRYTDFTQLTGYLGNIRLNATGQSFTLSPRALAVPGGVRNGQQFNLAAVALPPEFGSGFNNNPSGAAPGSAAYAAYYANPLRFFGSLGPSLSQVHGPRFSSEDLSLLKKTRVTETLTFELGAEFFNVFNRSYFFFPTTDFRQDNLGTNGIAGFQSVGAGDPRRIQIRLRLLF
jgi:hypothetical protein